MRKNLLVLVLAGSIASNFVVGSSLLMALLGPAQNVSGFPIWTSVVGASWEIFVEVPLAMFITGASIYLLYALAKEQEGFLDEKVSLEP